MPARYKISSFSLEGHHNTIKFMPYKYIESSRHNFCITMNQITIQSFHVVLPKEPRTMHVAFSQIGSHSLDEFTDQFMQSLVHAV